VTPETLDLFRAYVTAGKCTCTPRVPGQDHEECPECQRRTKAHGDLWEMLCLRKLCRPWQWPCIERPSATPPENAGRRAARERWRALEAALETERSRDALSEPVPESDLEPRPLDA
jgi:hypothetical protein